MPLLLFFSDSEKRPESSANCPAQCSIVFYRGKAQGEYPNQFVTWRYDTLWGWWRHFSRHTRACFTDVTHGYTGGHSRWIGEGLVAFVQYVNQLKITIKLVLSWSKMCGWFLLTDLEDRGLEVYRPVWRSVQWCVCDRETALDQQC